MRSIKPNLLIGLQASILVLIMSALPALAQMPKIRVACVGNSITIGYGLPDPSTAYPQQLGRLLGGNYDVRNFGVSGRTMLKKGDYPYWKESFYREALAFKPQILTICLGTNDSKPWNWKYKSEFFDDYMDMIKSFREVNPNVQVFVCLPPPAFSLKFGISDSVIRNAVIPIVKAVAVSSNSYTIDFYDSMTGDGRFFFDGIHPDSTGDSIMAHIAFEAIEGSPSGIIRRFSAGKPDAQGKTMLLWETTSGSGVKLNGKSVGTSGSMMVTASGNSTYTLTTSGVVSDTCVINFPLQH